MLHRKMLTCAFPDAVEHLQHIFFAEGILEKKT